MLNQKAGCNKWPVNGGGRVRRRFY